MALEAPFTAQDVFEQEFTPTARFIKRAVISTHYCFDFGFLDQLLEGWQVSIVQVVFGNDGVEGVTLFFRTGVDRIMLGASRHFKIPGMVPLEAFDKLCGHFASKEWVLAPGFLSAPPARVAENVDIRRPEGQSLELIGAAVTTQGFVVFGAALVTDGGGDLVD